MFHVNPWLKEQGPYSYLASIFMPEYYVAFSITDFLKNKGNILPTWKLWSEEISYFGKAIVHFPPVPYTYTSTGPADAEISDGIETLAVKLSQNMMAARKAGQLNDRGSLYEVRICYDPKSGIIRIIDYKTGPPVGDTSIEPEPLPVLVGVLSPA